MKHKTNFLILLLLSVCFTSFAQKTDYPLIGAQVFIEPGQTDADIEHFFSVLENSGLEVARIRMFGSHMIKPDGNADFSLYDKAFDAAEKHGVKLFATLFPPTDELTDVGGFKFPRSKQHLAEIDDYFKKVVSHFSEKPALYAWVLQNEPGSESWKIHETDLSKEIRSEWEKTNPPYMRSEGYLTQNFDDVNFGRYYLVWFMNHIAEEIAKYDKAGHYLHINPHALMDTIQGYDFKSLENILTSLGVSMHFSWHFGHFPTDEFPDGVAIMCDIIREGAGKNPFWVTEIQGGNVTGSGMRALCPTSAQTSQWLLTSIASGCEGVIFWTLNPRKTAMEAGEWALIDYMGNPSDRLEAAAAVTSFTRSNKELFNKAKPYKGPYAILYNNESFVIQAMNSTNKDSENPARSKSAVIKSVIASYEALQSKGKQANVYDMDRFDWNVTTHPVAIVPNSVCIPERFHSHLRKYVSDGGHLIITGLSGYFDDDMKCSFMGGHPLADLLGGNLLEFKVVDKYFDIDVQNQPVTTHLWKGIIECKSGVSIAKSGKEVLAVRNSYGKGTVDWIPTPIELGGNIDRLGNLYISLGGNIEDKYQIFSYNDTHINTKIMDAGDKLIYVITNTGSSDKKLSVRGKIGKKLSLMFGKADISNTSLKIDAFGYALLTIDKSEIN